jgi:hypothetical protein
MELQTEYTLEHLTEKTVNILISSYVVLNNEKHILESSRACYGNSPIGREHVIQDLPQIYQEAIFTIWGDTAILQDPTPPNN